MNRMMGGEIYEKSIDFNRSRRNIRLIMVVAIVLGIGFMSQLIFVALEAGDRQTCGRVQEEAAQDLTGFYVTDEERAACDRAGMTI